MIINEYLILTGINILLAWSCYVILLTGQISIGNAAFMAIGGYLSGILTVKFGLPLVLALIIATLATAVFGVVIGFPAIRLNGVYLIMVTIGVASSVQTLFENIEYVGGVQGLSGMNGTSVSVVIISLVIVGAIIWLISKSPLQRVFEAVREDEQVAASVGVHVTTVKVAAFGFGAAIAALGGGLYSHYMTYISPDVFGIMTSIIMLLYVIFGGTNNMWGPVLGAVIMTLLPEFIRFLADWRITVFGLLIVIILLFRPEGLLAFRIPTVRLRPPDTKPVQFSSSTIKQ